MTDRSTAIRRMLVDGRVHAQSMVEFALLLPAVVLLIMGALQIALISMVWINLYGLAQDTTRWMAVSSQAGPPDGSCNPTASTIWPRPRWSIGDDGIAYRNCNLPPLLTAANFSAPVWSPACANTVDCWANGSRSSDGRLDLTLTYNWSNVLILPVINGGGITSSWTLPTTVTVTAHEVMQY
jgi:hypothetical protein